MRNTAAAEVELVKADIESLDFKPQTLPNLLGDVAASALERGNLTSAKMVLTDLDLDLLPLKNRRQVEFIKLFILAQKISAFQLQEIFPKSYQAVQALGLVEKIENESDCSGQNKCDYFQAILDLRPTWVDANNLNYEGAVNNKKLDEDLTLDKNLTLDKSEQISEKCFWVVSDLGEQQTGRALASDHVLGIGRASLALAALTPRKSVAKVIDMGTGCGIQALYASTHAQQVVATDISERALRCAQLSAALSGVEVDFRQGSLFDPVNDEEFDLVVTNPPFVITPDTVRQGKLMEYRDGGMPGDSLSAQVVSQVGNYLKPGGVAVMLLNWEIHAENEESVFDWLKTENSAFLDAWLVERDRLDPVQYAEMWLRDGGITPNDPQWPEILENWVRDFSARHVTEIAMGTLVLRKVKPVQDLARLDATVSTSACGILGVRRYERISTTGNSPLGGHVQEVLHFINCLRRWNLINAQNKDHGILGENDSKNVDGKAENSKWPVVAQLTGKRAADLVEMRAYLPGASDPQVITLRQAQGYGRELQVDTVTAAVVGALELEEIPENERLTIGQIATALQSLGISVDRERLANTILELAMMGMIELWSINL